MVEYFKIVSINSINSFAANCELYEYGNSCVKARTHESIIRLVDSYSLDNNEVSIVVVVVVVVILSDSALCALSCFALLVADLL